MVADDTIVASATPPGRGGVAVVRLSGPLVKALIKHIIGIELQPRFATYAHFKDEDGSTLDIGIALYFPAPASFTGEDILELQGHGGPVVIDSLVQRAVSLGARLARPGEFSERAFLNGKMDLAQVEAVADLINASSEQAARSALRSLQGDFSQKVHEVVELVVRIRMYVEAAIDFVEEEIDFLADNQVQLNLNTVLAKLAALQQSAAQGHLLQEGIHLVIAGRPNVGKSSLLNCLSEKDRAIVSDIAGTTRDVLREQIVLDGMPIHVIDTAGLHDSEDRIEREGMRRAQHEIAQADVILWVTDTDCSTITLLEKVPPQAVLVIVRNKMDLTDEKVGVDLSGDITRVSVSAKTGEGIELLKSHIKTRVGLQSTQEGTFSARRRHLDALAKAKGFINNGLQQLMDYKAGELLAEELRQAQMALNEITGEFTADDLLGKIFSSFCIGK